MAAQSKIVQSELKHSELAQKLNQQFEDFKSDIKQQQSSPPAPPRARTFGVMPFPNPVSWLFEKIFAKYKGQLNNGIDEILKNAEVKVTLLEGSVNGGYDNTLNINIKVAATILDEYAAILKFFIEKDDTPSDVKERLNREHSNIPDQLNQLKLAQYKHEVTLLNYHKSQYIDKLLAPGCFLGFFNCCYSSRCNELRSVGHWLREISLKANHFHQIIGALMLVYNKLDNIDNKEDRNFLRNRLLDIFKIDTLSTDKPLRENYINEFKQWANEEDDIQKLDNFYSPPSTQLASKGLLD